jgi:hypothetical protein
MIEFASGGRLCNGREATARLSIRIAANDHPKTFASFEARS